MGLVLSEVLLLSYEPLHMFSEMLNIFRSVIFVKEKKRGEIGYQKSVPDFFGLKRKCVGKMTKLVCIKLSISISTKIVFNIYFWSSIYCPRCGTINFINTSKIAFYEIHERSRPGGGALGDTVRIATQKCFASRQRRNF